MAQRIEHLAPLEVPAERSAAIIEQEGNAQQRVLGECEHDDINVLKSVGSAFDDHETTYGACRRCGMWVVTTAEFGGQGRIETRPMTMQERGWFTPSFESGMLARVNAPDRIVMGHRFSRDD